MKNKSPTSKGRETYFVLGMFLVVLLIWDLFFDNVLYVIQLYEFVNYCIYCQAGGTVDAELGRYIASVGDDSMGGDV